MTFNEARDELKRISKGEYRSMTYDLTDNVDKTMVICRVYTDSHGLFRGSTWGEALDKLRCAVNPPPIQPPNLEEAPE